MFPCSAGGQLDALDEAVHALIELDDALRNDRHGIGIDGVLRRSDAYVGAAFETGAEQGAQRVPVAACRAGAAPPPST